DVRVHVLQRVKRSGTILVNWQRREHRPTVVLQQDDCRAGCWSSGSGSKKEEWQEISVECEEIYRRIDRPAFERVSATPAEAGRVCAGLRSARNRIRPSGIRKSRGDPAIQGSGRGSG